MHKLILLKTTTFEETISLLDKNGRPALEVGCRARTVTMIKPLSNPLGGTEAKQGRHPEKC